MRNKPLKCLEVFCFHGETKFYFCRNAHSHEPVHVYKRTGPDKIWWENQVVGYTIFFSWNCFDVISLCHLYAMEHKMHEWPTFMIDLFSSNTYSQQENVHCVSFWDCLIVYMHALCFVVNLFSTFRQFALRIKLFQHTVFPPYNFPKPSVNHLQPILHYLKWNKVKKKS